MDCSRFAGRVAAVLVVSALLAACGGGGSDSGGFVPPTDTTAPTVPGSLQVAGTTSSSVSLSWAASTDSGGSGLAGYRVFRNGGGTAIASVTGTAYTDTGLAASTPYTHTVLAYDNAGNQSAQTGPVSATTQAPPAGNITVTGRVTFDRPSYRTTNPVNTLNFGSLQRLPVRGATLEVLRASDQALLATTATDANGDYSAAFASTPIIVRVKAQLLRAGVYDFEVRNNTNGNALYALDSSTVTPGSNNITLNLNAATGWGGSSYTGTRSAAPFSILDMLYRAKELLQQAEPGLTMTALDVHWSVRNRGEDPDSPCDGRFANPETGQIGTTFYLTGTVPAEGGCPAIPTGIYVLGDASGDAADDADEFDVSVIAHEFGHYYEDKFSRSDSMGGPHSLDSKLDLTIAFSEGFGNAFQGFVLNDPVYRDTVGTGGQLVGITFDMENDGNRSGDQKGYFAEASVMDFLWDVFDPADDDDPLNLGFRPIHEVMRDEMLNTDALTSIYVMANALATRFPASAAAIRSRLTAESIAGAGDFGAGETASEGLSPDGLLPVYRDVELGVQSLSVYSTNQFGITGSPALTYASFNRLGGRRYLRIVLADPATLRIRVDAPDPPDASHDPDFVLYRRGAPVCAGFSPPAAFEEQVCPGLATGTYVLEIAECTNLGKVGCGRDSPEPKGETGLRVTVTQP